LQGRQGALTNPRKPPPRSTTMPRLSRHVNVEELSARYLEKPSSAGVERQPAFHSLAFASRYTEKKIPKFELPETSTPANAVYQLVKDHLELEGKPIQNMATFVSTWMEPEADRLLKDNINKNFADKEEYPQTVGVQDRCVNMLARLYNAPTGCNPVGTSCVGSSEAIMLGCLAAKFRWRKRMEAMGKSTNKPNIVFGSNAHGTTKGRIVEKIVQKALIVILHQLW